jgi:hypothetical protein
LRDPDHFLGDFRVLLERSERFAKRFASFSRHLRR